MSTWYTSVLLIFFCSYSTSFLTAIPLIFCHGFNAGSRQARHYHDFHCGELIVQDFPEIKNQTLANLAQEGDIEHLDSMYVQFGQHHTNKPILMGVSRGASVILNWLKIKQRHIAAAVLESPFASVQDIINNRVNSWYFLTWLPYLSRLLHWFAFGSVWAPSYNPYGLQPINNLEKIPLDIPLFLYTSFQDEVIPMYSTLRLYKKLKELGHTKLHLLVLDHGTHANIIRDQDGQRSKQVIHAFFKHYGLPHNPELAALGQDDFEFTQPSVAEVSVLMPQASWWHRIDV